MYPFIRIAIELFSVRNAKPLGANETHVTRLRVWPWDIDMFMDLNNGRVLTLFDIGRMAVFSRTGAIRAMKKRGWFGVVAGSAIRYRRRITMFQKIELRSCIIGWDERFTYVEQSFWRHDHCLAHAVIRTAVTSGKGIISPNDVAVAADLSPESPELPDWVSAWKQAEDLRPWPPT